MRLWSIALVLLALPGAAAAQPGDSAWLERPIRLVVPFPAGASTDVGGR